MDTGTLAEVPPKKRETVDDGPGSSEPADPTLEAACDRLYGNPGPHVDEKDLQ